MKITKLCLLTALPLFSADLINAAELDKNTARMQAMDKITGRVSVIEVPVNGNVNFGSLSVVVRSCKTRPVEETPENFAFVDVTDKDLKGNETNIFKGWMISSSPATNAVEHPIYDVWLLQCLDMDIKKEQLLTPQQLAERDEIPLQKRPTAATRTVPEKQLATQEDENKTPQPLNEPISEMYYDPADEEVETENVPQNLLHPAPQPSEPDEFSFDEDDEMSEIQSQLDKIKQEMAPDSATSTLQ